jgi:hypothetical protein
MLVDYLSVDLKFFEVCREVRQSRADGRPIGDLNRAEILANVESRLDNGYNIAACRQLVLWVEAQLGMEILKGTWCSDE